MPSEIVEKPYILENRVQYYAWGMSGKNAFIPKLLDIEIENKKSYAEIWIGGHPKAPSKIVFNHEKMDLNQVINKYPDKILGPAVKEKFAGQLPFLLKVLSAGEALSIQTHPDKATAQQLHAADPEHYPDANHKPEIAIAIDYLKALIGFRPLHEINAFLEDYTEILELIGVEHIDSLNDDDDLKNIFSEMMKRSQQYPEILATTCQNFAKKIRNKHQISERDQLFLQLYPKYGNDVGLMVLYFLNLVNISSGEGVYLDAGVPHAYLQGNIVECMANSDNVVRAGLTPKYKDVQTLIDITDYKSGKPEIQRPNQNSDNLTKYNVPSPEFEISRYILPGTNVLDLQDKDKVEIYLALEGEVIIQDQNNTMPVKQGQSVLIPACLSDYKIVAERDSILFRVSVP